MKGLIGMDEIKEIAMRIKELREICDFSVEEVATKIGVDTATYVEYEESGNNIPINAIFQLAKLYKVDLSEILTGVSAKLDTYQVVRAGEGPKVDRYPGYEFDDLAYHYNNKLMQPLIVTLDPSDKPAELVSHKGEEFNYVLEGVVVVTFGDQELVLEKGDSIYFNPTYPHGQKCGGNTPATFLTMIAE
ncbi:MAG: XRE family transcriptional regulator [Lachnospiraceae bacterium]|nr:XRE family transcriptional regulator [Lachnospiraceae bacterium]